MRLLLPRGVHLPDYVQRCSARIRCLQNGSTHNNMACTCLHGCRGRRNAFLVTRISPGGPDAGRYKNRTWPKSSPELRRLKGRTDEPVNARCHGQFAERQRVLLQGARDAQFPQIRLAKAREGRHGNELHRSASRTCNSGFQHFTPAASMDGQQLNPQMGGTCDGTLNSAGDVMQFKVQEDAASRQSIEHTGPLCGKELKSHLEEVNLRGESLQHRCNVRYSGHIEGYNQFRLHGILTF